MNRNRRTWLWIFGLIATIAIFYYVLTIDVFSKKQPISTAQKENIDKVNSIEEMNKIFLEMIKNQKKQSGRIVMEDSAANAEQSTEMTTDTSNHQMNSMSGKEHSETNIQVSGIDESDIVKTDGRYIYQLTDATLNIIQAVPSSQMNVEKTISFENNVSPSQLFIYDNQLIVIASKYEEAIHSNGKMSKRRMQEWYQATAVLIYDITNKSNPKLTRELEIEGNYLSSRLMDGNIFVASSHYPDIWILEDEKSADLRPRYKDSSVNNDIKPIPIEEINIIPEPNEGNFTNIAAIDLSQPAKEMTLTSFLGSGNQMYMSASNIYLASVNYPIMPLFAKEKTNETTTIYKLNINGLEMELAGVQELEGRLLNQFSMDEYEGHFRVAMTKGDTRDNARPSSNDLYIFNEQFEKVGELTGLARGERIYSARFMGDKVYIVTFKETDPLFVIDASKPKSPRVLGELKIPGFSNYLHPYDENHLIGFGYDTQVTVSKEPGAPPIITTEGVKLSLFDVSDLSNPKEKYTEIIGGRGTYSELNYDHKALLFDKSKDLFAFPISVYEETKNVQDSSTFAFQGAFIYGVDVNEGFQLKSKITHHNNGSGYENWEDSINRTLYIGDQLYAVSPAKVTAHNLNTFNKVGEVELFKK